MSGCLHSVGSSSGGSAQLSTPRSDYRGGGKQTIPEVHTILRDMVKKRAVHILLECILVYFVNAPTPTKFMFLEKLLPQLCLCNGNGRRSSLYSGVGIYGIPYAPGKPYPPDTLAPDTLLHLIPYPPKEHGTRNTLTPPWTNRHL